MKIIKSVEELSGKLECIRAFVQTKLIDTMLTIAQNTLVKRQNMEFVGGVVVVDMPTGEMSG